MINLTADTRIFAATGPTDMRKGFDGLCGLVTSVIEQDPLTGALFLFVNRRRDRLKILYWDGDGLAIWYKRLEQGTFQMPQVKTVTRTVAGDNAAASVQPAPTTPAPCIEMRSDELVMLLRGIDYSSVKRRKRFAIAS